MPDQPTPYYAKPKQPRLIWNNRDKRRAAEPLPTQTVEIIRPFHADQVQGALDMISEAAPENRLIWTNDNLVALTSLLHGDGAHEPLEGKVDLIYIDPPFAVQSDFKINVEIENGLSDEKLPTLIEEIAYKDTWKDGLDSYLSMMRDRLELLKQLLAPTGSIYVHCDWHAGHYLKVLMDEVFGYENFISQIIWKRSANTSSIGKIWKRSQDLILFYSNSDDYVFNFQYKDLSSASHELYQKQDKTGNYQLVPILVSGKRNGETGKIWRGIDPNTRGKTGMHWVTKPEKLDLYYDQGLIVFPSKEGGVPRLKYYLADNKGVVVSDLWDDINPISSGGKESFGFPTQKPVELIQRIISASSNPDDLVLDCFSGSGTTVVAAETIKDADGKAAPRRWIAIDNGKFAIHLTRKRLIEANARPFAVENIGFYARSGEWRDVGAKSPSAKLYRNAMVEVYGGAPVEGFTYLHGRKGARWVHVGPLNAPVVEAQLECIAREAAATDVRSVDVLSADIDIDFNRSEIERKYGVTIQAKIIPQAAIDAVRERLKRKKAKDPNLEMEPDIHFFSPPDVEIRATPSGAGGVTVKLTRLTVDLDDCLSTQDAAKRAEIKCKLTDWRSLVDYWAVDWDYNGHYFVNQWQSFRTRKRKDIAPQAAHVYTEGPGEKRIAVKVTDIFGNDGVKIIRVTV